MSWGALLLLAFSGGLYARAVRILGRRGVEVGRWQQAAWYGGLSLMAVALFSPLDRWSQELMVAHMAQHLIIADLAAPLMLTGLRAPVLLFFLPRPVLVALARRPGLRRLSALRRPVPAIAIYVTLLYAWHIDALFTAALRSDLVHGLQHQSFIVGSLLVWWAALEPQRRRMPGGLWKIGHIIGARLPGMMLGMAFIAMRVPVYTSVYGEGDRMGLSAVADQQVAGGLMLTLDTVILMVALSMFFWRSASDNDRDEQRVVAT
jgi:cytochrome c oxidase assembly factor CtaG